MAHQSADKARDAAQTGTMTDAARTSLTDAALARLVMQHASDLIAVLDGGGRFVLASPSYAALLGFEPRSLIGVDLVSLVHPDDLEHVRRHWDNLDSEADARDTFRHRHADGSWRWLEARGNRFQHNGAQLVVVIARDVTRRTQDQRLQRFLFDATELLSSSLDYGATLDTLAHLVVPFLADWCRIDTRDEAGAIRTVAFAHADVAKEALGREMVQRFPIDPGAPGGMAAALRTGEPQVIAEVDELLAEGGASDEQRRLLHELGVCSSVCVPLVARGRVLGAITLVSAQADRRYGPADLPLLEDLARRASLAVDNALLFEAERKARAEAEDAVHLRDAWMSLASHELRTPLTSLIGHLELLQRRDRRDDVLDERARLTLQTMRDQSARLSQMVATLLDVTRIDQGGLKLERSPIDLTDLVRRVAHELQPALDLHPIVVGGDMETLPVLGDALRLEQVVQNLVQNAAKYSPGGGEVRIELERRNGYAVLSVSDRGIGIPPEALPRIFQRFFRAPNAEGQIEGLGIGLYVVREIVKLHDGEITVESVEGQGATFTLHLPAND